MSNFYTYQQFFSLEQAEPVLIILKEHDIPFEFKQSRKIVDAVIAGESSSDHLFELKIPATRFEEVNRLLQQGIQANIEELDDDYYLLSFSDEELKDILRKPDEWSNQDVAIARALLEKKGITYTDHQLNDLRDERTRVLARPDKIRPRLLFGGFVCAIFFAPIGLIMGSVIWQQKKTLPNGQREYVYDYPSRQKGKIIFIIGLVLTLFGIIGTLIRSFDLTY